MQLLCFAIVILAFATIPFGSSSPVPDKEFTVILDEGAKNLPVLSGSAGETWPSLQFVVATSDVQEGTQTVEGAEVEIASFWRNFGSPIIVEVLNQNEGKTVAVQEPAVAIADPEGEQFDVETFVVPNSDTVETFVAPNSDNIETFVVPNSDTVDEELPEFRAHEPPSESTIRVTNPTLNKYSYIPSPYQNQFQSTEVSGNKKEGKKEEHVSIPSVYSPGTYPVPVSPLTYNPQVAVAENPASQQTNYLTYPNQTPVYVNPSRYGNLEITSPGNRYVLVSSPYPGGMIIHGNCNSILTPTYRQSTNTITNPGAPTLYYPNQFPQQQPNYALSPRYSDAYKVGYQPQNILTYPMVNSVSYK